jgi:hypothetical protein
MARRLLTSWEPEKKDRGRKGLVTSYTSNPGPAPSHQALLPNSSFSYEFINGLTH